MRPNPVEMFVLELREVICTARRLKGLKLGGEPVYAPLRATIDLLCALGPLDPLLEQASNRLQDTEERMTLADLHSAGEAMAEGG